MGLRCRISFRPEPYPHIISHRIIKHGEAAWKSSFEGEGHMPEIGQNLSHYSIVEKIGNGIQN